MAKAKEPTFEDALTRLEEIVARLEEGPPTLQETLALFEEGVAVGHRLQTLLAAAETKVRGLIRNDAGELELTEGDEL